MPEAAAATAASGAAATAAARVNAEAVAAVSPDGIVRTLRSYRSNRFEFVSDVDGTTRSAHFEINESATGLDRSSAEVRAQGEAADRGVSTDHGGHIIAHRFASDQGDINMFPQDAQFNNSAYKTVRERAALVGQQRLPGRRTRHARHSAWLGSSGHGHHRLRRDQPADR